MTYYLKSGNKFTLTDEESLQIYKKLPPHNYVVKFDDQRDCFYLEKADNFVAPKKIYGDTMQNRERIFHTYQDRVESTGILLVGEKGSGKSLLAKMLSIKGIEEGIPTLIINTPYIGDSFNMFIQSIHQECIILFDEFEKVYNSDRQKAVLTLLDGMYPQKKLFILTANNKWSIDSHMRNRPGRLFYLLEYDGLEASFVEEYCKDNLKYKEHLKELKRIFSVFTKLNFDMLKAIVEEVNRYNESPLSMMKLLNVKVEFDEEITYSVSISYNGKPIILESDTWNGKALVAEELEFYSLDKITKSLTSYEFTRDDMYKYDDFKGEFYFKNSTGHILTLSKSIAKSYYNPLAA